jgi:hypothetical protein
VVVYAWARELHGPAGAALALALATFSPTLLAHGHLVTTDAGVTALALLALWAFSRLVTRLTWARAVACGAALGAALAAKFSALFLLPSLPASWLARAWLERRRAATPPPCPNGGTGTASSPPAASPGARPERSSTARALLAAAIVAGMACTVIWGAYGFRARPSPDPAFQLDWRAVEGERGAVADGARFLARHGILPQGYPYGMLLSRARSRDRTAYAFGRYSTDGWWWYFPAAFLVKTPAPALLLYAWGLYAVLRGGRGGLARGCHLLAPLVIYWLVAMATPLNIGVRHLLPVHPLLAVVAGAVVAAPAPPWRRRAAVLLAGATAASCLWAAPYFIPFFNLPARAVFAPHEMLVDSNLDWGQDLGRLKRYLDAHGVGTIKLSYFGAASPRYIGLDHEVLPAANVSILCEKDHRLATALHRGDYVAISATNLVGASFPAEFRDDLRAFREMEPHAVIGGSIFVHLLDADSGARGLAGE